MAKDFKDFSFLGKKLSDLDTKYISVDFSQNPDTIFALSRNIKYNDSNRYRHEPNISWSGFDDKLKFELHLVKDDGYYAVQDDRIISEAEVRALTRWLTSTDSSQFLEFDYSENASGSDSESVRFFFGQFVNIEPFNLDGLLYGLKLNFECSSAFGYSDIITDTISCRGDAVSYTLMNQDDRLNDYCYPVISVQPKTDGEAYICNLSDCTILMEGTLVSADSPSFYMEQLMQKIRDYGLSHGYAPGFTYLEDGTTAKTICSNTAVQFWYTASDGSSQKCIACYIISSKKFYIIRGGFLYFNVKKDLQLSIHCEKLFIFDETQHMIKFPDIGISDVDYMYWPRLVSGTNHLLLWGGDLSFTLCHRETRKAGI